MKAFWIQPPFDVLNKQEKENPNPLEPEKVVKKITSFHNENEFLSNFYESEIIVPIETDHGIEKVIFSTVEHAFQASKVKDKDIQKVIRDAKTPKQAKKLGRKVKLRPDWESIKFDVMEKLVKAKFIQNNHLKMKLLYTGDAELIEGTYKDDIWGVNKDGVGENHLGKILMKVRQEIIETEGTFDECLSRFFRDNNLEFLSNYGRNIKKDTWEKALKVSKQYGSMELIEKMMFEAEVSQ